MPDERLTSEELDEIEQFVREEAAKPDDLRVACQPGDNWVSITEELAIALIAAARLAVVDDGEITGAWLRERFNDDDLWSVNISNRLELRVEYSREDDGSFTASLMHCDGSQIYLPEKLRTVSQLTALISALGAQP